ncbi:DUF4185 domain-containing protein [Corynebacterium timonense]|uniref:DUF4185 domain-containing protein n=1 Tax=Corynebacterium timonense TaxID=441500 RepID=A0A1H1QJA4_9CORY|nr:DUF4185 domain-containing protein [Corynebacterium timonense]SDS23393.1 protein of unknown function [Corynebacterium timonense]
MRFPSRSLALLVAGATTLSLVTAPSAGAQSSLSSTASSVLGSSGRVDNSDTHPKEPGTPVEMPGGVIVRIMGDLLGRGLSDHVGFRSGDLGVMAPLGNGGDFALIFGDSFRGATLGAGEWMSPVGVVAQLANGVVEILRPLNQGNRVNQLIPYERADGDILTLIPSDVINLDGTLYMQGMWNRGIGNVQYTEIWKSTDNGATWDSVGTTSADYMGGMGNLISWERGADGYIYVVSSSFTRTDSVYLSRFRPEQIGDRTTWQLFDPTTGTWSDHGTPILSTGVKAGEMNLRYIDGHWVLVMFNAQTLQIEVRASPELARDWNDVPAAVVAKNGPWRTTQSPANFSQLYGGYIVPGSTLAKMDIVISQWNTSTNARYNATQFNVTGLDVFFGLTEAPTADNSDVEVTEVPAADAGSLSPLHIALISVLGLLGLGALVASLFPAQVADLVSRFSPF